MRVDPEVLEEVAGALERELRRLTGDSSGSLLKLETEAAIPPQGAWFGGWQTAREMEYGYTTAHDAVVYYYRELVLQLENAVGLLRMAAVEHKGTDEAVAAAHNAQAAGLEAGAETAGGGGGGGAVVVA